MRKEIICYVNTNEEGEEVSVQRVTEGPEFVLLRLGQMRLVLNKHELVHAIETCDMYGKIFDEEQRTIANKEKLEASRAKAAAAGFSVPDAAPIKPKTTKRTSKSKEEDGAFVMDVDFNKGPSPSELELERITRLMNGPELEVKENK